MLEHPDFGPLRASECAGGRLWLWEALDLHHTPRGDADLGFEAGASGPGPAHESQLEEIVAELDALTDAAAPMIDAKLGGRFKQSLDGAPWAELEWQGALVTGSGGAFRLHYSCRSYPEAMITVRFEHSRPVDVQVCD